MRVISGKARSLTLKTMAGDNTRPTTDRTKETLFNMLQPMIPSHTFLDLFSGSGAIGIEALSRGASRAVFVEQNREALRCIRENLKFTRLEEDAIVYGSDVFSTLRKLEGTEHFDCVFMDPPYNKELERQVLEYLSDSQIIDEHSLIVVEASLQTDFSYLEEIGFVMTKYKKYKTNAHVFIKKR
ncbi:MAG: 16S rRNA (guanine(966)-N(2))-methyltransferase RsmD [Lachnospiraceae bacterium]|nr:16S rRNA (guanine(966)-N(2))-methyltransferase RsmD [Lachnospiraceae bacterium]MDD3614982.1 16S rRNA (guanine(966)-N(2))-methyltransferase RsmD [Lachnospiraceae bacterium]